MGAQESKIEEGLFERDVETSTEAVPSTPGSPLDPRSPSAQFARTPLEMILRRSKSEPIEPHQVILGVDPRSPTTEFDRTPIVLDTVPRKIHNKNLDNVLGSSSQNGTPSRSDSTPNKRRSIAGLLETNIDFTETHLDEVILSKASRAKETTIQPLVEAVEALEIAEEVQEEAAEPEVTTSEAALPESTELTTSEAVLPESTELTTSEAALPESTELTEQKTMEKPLEDDTINVTALSKNFDKKLTNLIYEDGNEVLSPKRDVLASLVGQRTPLGARNSNSEPRRHLAKLRVSDKPRKSEGISRIPVFKNKMAGLQCENTPPTTTEGTAKKAQLTKWDADKTLVI